MKYNQTYQYIYTNTNKQDYIHNLDYLILNII